MRALFDVGACVPYSHRVRGRRGGGGGGLGESRNRAIITEGFSDCTAIPKKLEVSSASQLLMIFAAAVEWGPHVAALADMQ